MARRQAAATSVAAALLIGGLLGASCDSSGDALARQACSKVHSSISQYRSSLHATDPRTAARLRNDAYETLRSALPTAADANSSNGEWNALMTTISESARVGEGHLITALRAQCAVADSNNQNLPVAPTTYPPLPGQSRAPGGTGSGATGSGDRPTAGP